jgi:hypothetical protein
MHRENAPKKKLKSMPLNSDHVRAIDDLFRRFHHFRIYPEILKRRKNLLERSARLSVGLVNRVVLRSQVQIAANRTCVTGATRHAGTQNQRQPAALPFGAK